MSARAALGFLFAPALVIGLTAAVLPRTFYDDFPFLAHWVELLPPYNEHLVTDVGGLYLGFAVLFAWAAWTLDRTLVRAVCVAWLLTADDPPALPRRPSGRLRHRRRNRRDRHPGAAAGAAADRDLGHRPLGEAVSGLQAPAQPGSSTGAGQRHVGFTGEGDGE